MRAAQRRLGAAVSHAPRRCTNTGNALRGNCVSASCSGHMLPPCGSQAHVTRHMAARPTVLARARMPRHLSTVMRAWSATVDDCRRVSSSCEWCAHIWPTEPQLAERAYGLYEPAVVVGDWVMVSFSQTLSQWPLCISAVKPRSVARMEQIIASSR